MFNLRDSKPIEFKPDLRDAMFGDYPWQWMPLQGGGPGPGSEPWASFSRAKQQIEAGDSNAASLTLQTIADTPGLESRQYLQAWHFLRELGVEPVANVPKTLLGVVVEVAMPKGLDIVAAWADHRARYYNFSGAGVIWERPNDSLDTAMDDLLIAGLPVLRAIGPWDRKRPPAPTKDIVRINLLSPSGLHFGEAPGDVLSRDPMGGPVLAAALRLMQALMAVTKVE